MERECLDCGLLLRGRSDQKFCDDHCRSAYNNRKKADSFSAMRPVNAILRKNYTILSRYYKGRKVKLRKDDLLRQGFDLEYHTRQYISSDGTACYCCYDFGYTILEEERALVISKTTLRI